MKLRLGGVDAACGRKWEAVDAGILALVAWAGAFMFLLITCHIANEHAQIVAENFMRSE